MTTSMRTTMLAAVISLMLLNPIDAFSENTQHKFHVKDAAIAIKIAKAAVEQEFGTNHLEELKWFEATIVGDKWIVYGHPYKHGQIPRHGGSVDIEIAVEGGTILEITFEM